MLLAATAYVETFVMLWITGAVFCFLRWREIAGTEDDLGWLGSLACSPAGGRDEVLRGHMSRDTRRVFALEALVDSRAGIFPGTDFLACSPWL